MPNIKCLSKNKLKVHPNITIDIDVSGIYICVPTNKSTA